MNTQPIRIDGKVDNIWTNANSAKTRDRRLYLIALGHVGIGISIVALSSYVNSEMKFLGWESASISIFLGSAIIFELFRLYFAYLHDKYVKTRSFLAFGLTCALLGLLLIPSALFPIGNLLLVIVGGLFYTGSSIISTLIDAHLTAVTLPIQRNRVAG